MDFLFRSLSKTPVSNFSIFIDEKCHSILSKWVFSLRFYNQFRKLQLQKMFENKFICFTFINPIHCSNHTSNFSLPQKKTTTTNIIWIILRGNETRVWWEKRIDITKSNLSPLVSSKMCAEMFIIHLKIQSSLEGERKTISINIKFG